MHDEDQTSGLSEPSSPFSLASISVREMRTPSGVHVYTGLGRRSIKRQPEVVWSRCYHCTCTLIALLVGSSPLMIIFFLPLMNFNSDSIGIAAAWTRAPTDLCSSTKQLLTVNASIKASNGQFLAIALLVDEGPRSEYRRIGRVMMAKARTQAVADGMTIFAFAPCSLPAGVWGVLAAHEAQVACRLAQAVVSHSCQPNVSTSGPSVPKAARPAIASSSCRQTPPSAGLPEACTAANSSAPQARAIDTVAITNIDGCHMSCTATSRSPRCATRSIQGVPRI